ncbi:unnamed protein product [Closterium sp. Yama58-4]|nr:unnamed protein product [Closterium sp. Yama58-4]
MRWGQCQEELGQCLEEKEQLQLEVGAAVARAMEERQEWVERVTTVARVGKEEMQRRVAKLLAQRDEAERSARAAEGKEPPSLSSRRPPLTTHPSGALTAAGTTRGGTGPGRGQTATWSETGSPTLSSSPPPRGAAGEAQAPPAPRPTTPTTTAGKGLLVVGFLLELLIETPLLPFLFPALPTLPSNPRSLFPRSPYGRRDYTSLSPPSTQQQKQQQGGVGAAAGGAGGGGAGGGHKVGGGVAGSAPGSVYDDRSSTTYGSSVRRYSSGASASGSVRGRGGYGYGGGMDGAGYNDQGYAAAAAAAAGLPGWSAGGRDGEIRPVPEGNVEGQDWLSDQSGGTTMDEVDEVLRQMGISPDDTVWNGGEGDAGGGRERGGEGGLSRYGDRVREKARERARVGGAREGRESEGDWGRLSVGGGGTGGGSIASGMGGGAGAGGLGGGSEGRGGEDGYSEADGSVGGAASSALTAAASAGSRTALRRLAAKRGQLPPKNSLSPVSPNQVFQHARDTVILYQ